MVALKATIFDYQVQGGTDHDQKRSVRKEVQAHQGAKCIDQYACHSLMITMINLLKMVNMLLAHHL